jgi:hypothetical protein
MPTKSIATGTAMLEAEKVLGNRISAIEIFVDDPDTDSESLVVE